LADGVQMTFVQHDHNCTVVGCPITQTTPVPEFNTAVHHGTTVSNP
jgi:hypothetical protein